MPPHCDSLDGPVVTAAREALDGRNVNLVLPFVHEDGEDEVRAAFDLALAARDDGAAARTVADRYFFETAVRVHRAGEGAAFNGLKPAGLDVGPVIPLAETAIGTGSPEELSAFLSDAVSSEVSDRLRHVVAARARAGAGLAEAREYVEAMLGLEVWAHHLYTAVRAPAHGEHDHA